ncbi:MAG: DUF3006 domain-containing protein [Chloroflexota bacterium]|nr:DUF3006 domain-containing protein [Chloroflexota bacterium]
MLRGVVDSLEEDWAIVVLDDGQRLDWPRENLPSNVREGMAITLDAAPVRATATTVKDGVWVGEVGHKSRGAAAQAAGAPICLGDQTLNWPEDATLKEGQAVAVHMAVDEVDTIARQQRVRRLLDDIFG